MKYEDVLSKLSHFPHLGQPMSDPGHNCAFLNGAVLNSWHSSMCSKKLSYICYSQRAVAPPTEGKKDTLVFLRSLLELD